MGNRVDVEHLAKRLGKALWRRLQQRKGDSSAAITGDDRPLNHRRAELLLAAGAFAGIAVAQILNAALHAVRNVIEPIEIVGQIADKRQRCRLLHVLGRGSGACRNAERAGALLGELALDRKSVV